MNVLLAAVRTAVRASSQACGLVCACLCVRVRVCVDSSRQQDNRVTLFHRWFAAPSKEIISLVTSAVCIWNICDFLDFFEELCCPALSYAERLFGITICINTLTPWSLLPADLRREGKVLEREVDKEGLLWRAGFRKDSQEVSGYSKVHSTGATVDMPSDAAERPADCPWPRHCWVALLTTLCRGAQDIQSLTFIVLRACLN